VLAGHDSSDACSADQPVPDYVAALTGSVEGLRIAVDLTSLSHPACDPDIAVLTHAAVDRFRDAGAQITEITLPLKAELETVTMTGLFTRHDLVLQPAIVRPGLRGDELALDYGSTPGTSCTAYWNAVGFPSMSFPMGLTSAGLPVGLLLSGRPFHEATVFRATDTFQSLTSHHLTESPVVLETLA
jgi:aspartyl-tRNA(Asn)/glutamyl-tRNA(Gln) amidotransferase subunit A